MVDIYVCVDTEPIFGQGIGPLSANDHCLEHCEFEIILRAIIASMRMLTKSCATWIYMKSALIHQTNDVVTNFQPQVTQHQ